MVESGKTIIIKIKKQLNGVKNIITKVENEIKVVAAKNDEIRKVARVRLSEAQKAENKKKRAEKTEKRKAEYGVAISDKKGKALAATLLFKQGVGPVALAKLKAQKESASDAAARRFNALSYEEKEAKKKRAATLAVASAKRRKEALANETDEQKAVRLENAAKRKEKLDKGFFAGMFPVK